MKKLIFSFLLVGTLLVPNLSKAQTSNPVDVTSAYVAALQQVIALLQQEVMGLVAQLNALSTQQQEIVNGQQQIITDLHQVQEQTAPPLVTVLPEATSTAVTAPFIEHIDIVSPISTKGLGREYKSYDWNAFDSVNIPDNERPVGFVFPDESNYIDIAAVLYNSDGTTNHTDTITVTATDSSQNKIVKGTGNISKITINGQKQQLYLYPFAYKFNFSGQHIITFVTSEGLTKSVALNVR